MNLFIKKLTKKLYLGGITLLFLFVVSSIWNFVVSLNTNLLITAVVILLTVSIASSLSDDKSDKWYRNN